ncbi:MAG: calcium-binding protein [Alphaproteobacteria bacterium]|nr:calcium-binding protein [Alphaproteobacteria bacterium]
MSQAWVKFQTQFVTIHAPVSEEIKARSWVNYFVQRWPPTPFSIGSGGFTPIPVGTPSIAPGERWWDIKFNLASDGTVSSIDYTLVLTRVVDVVTAPGFDPGAREGGQISIVIPSHDGPFAWTAPAFYWLRTDAVITDWDGNGYDDHGEHDYGPTSIIVDDPPFYANTPDPLPQDEALFTEFVRQFALSMHALGDLNEVPAAWANYVRNEELADPTRLFNKLGKILGPAGVILDFLEAGERVVAATSDPQADPMRVAFVEFATLAERYAWMTVGLAAGSALATPVGGVVASAGIGAIYNLEWKSSRQAFFGHLYDQAFGSTAGEATQPLAQTATDSAQAGFALFDARYYLASHADAAQAVRDGTASSALSHYLATGLAAGYRPSAQSDPLDPADVPVLLPGGPAAGPRLDMFAVELQGMAGDGLSASERTFVELLALNVAGAGSVVASRSLTAIANRMAIDGFANYRDGVALKLFPGRAATDMRNSEGAPIADFFPNLDLSSVKPFMVVGPWTNGAEAFAAFVNGGGLSGVPSGAAVGVAEYGGVWIILVGDGSLADGAPDVEQPFTVARYGLGRDESFYGGTHAAHFWGGGGNDSLIGGGGADRLEGGDGDDLLAGGGADDALIGGAGRDVLIGGAGADAMAGGAGNDTYVVDDEGDTVTELAGEGTDTVRTALGSRSDFAALYYLPDNVEYLTGTSGTGQGVWGSGADNVVRMGDGGDLVVLADRSDYYAAAAGNDDVDGGGGNDFLFFGGSFTNGDKVNGGAGFDTLGLLGTYSVTFDADDLVGIEKLAGYGSGDAAHPNGYAFTTIDANVASGQTLMVIGLSLRAGEHLVFDGSAENDGRFNLRGGWDSDTLTGGHGNDQIYGNLGADMLKGGGGNDSFEYYAVAESTAAARDSILEFSSGDRINLAAIDADGNGANGDTAFTFIGSAAFTAAGQVRAVEDAANPGHWTVEADLNGDGNADLSIAVTVVDGHAFAYTDFYL